jgi:hypothetical protein
MSASRDSDMEAQAVMEGIGERREGFVKQFHDVDTKNL